MPEAATQTLKEMGSAQTSARSIDDARVDAPRTKHAARMEALLARSEADWDAIQDAIVTVIGLRAGHTLTEADVDALTRVDAYHREDEESSTDAYIRGLDDGRAEAGGKEVADLLKRIDVLTGRLAAERGLRRFYAALSKPSKATDDSEAA